MEVTLSEHLFTFCIKGFFITDPLLPRNTTFITVPLWKNSRCVSANEVWNYQFRRDGNDSILASTNLRPLGSMYGILIYTRKYRLTYMNPLLYEIFVHSILFNFHMVKKTPTLLHFYQIAFLGIPEKSGIGVIPILSTLPPLIKEVKHGSFQS